MAVFYVLPATGFNIALDPDVVAEMDPENVVEVLNALFTSVGISAGAIKTIVIIAGFMFIYTFIANIASWSFGVNEVAKYAAEDGSMPKMFTPVNKEGVPYKAAIINGIVASIICILGIGVSYISEDATSSFGLFFSLSWITLLVGYIPMFLAFLKLRKTEPDTKRPYKMPGNKLVVTAYTLLAFFLIVAGVVFTIFGDFTMDYIIEYIPLIMGVIISFVIEEILVARIKPSSTPTYVAAILAVLGVVLIFKNAVLRPLWITLVVGCTLLCFLNLLFVSMKSDK
jgi:amino acid transporter